MADAQSAPENVNTQQCGDEVLNCHLERALQHAEHETVRYHLRQALQLREID